jgi:hypothetical protein
MTPFVTIGLLVAAVGFADGPKPSTLEAYRDRAAKCGPSPVAQIQLALWCEQNGLERQKVEHLARALRVDPDHPVARALLGQVRHREGWETSDRAAEDIRAEAARAAALADYHVRRDKAPETAEAQWKLAVWCGRHGLEREARAHLEAVVRLDPDREAAWVKLGCRKYQGRWLTPEQIAREAAERSAQRKADARWLASLRKVKGDLQGRSQIARASAEDRLAGVTDPRAARAVWAMFALGDEADQARAVRLFGQLDGPEAALDLAALTVYSMSAQVRADASATLVRRDPRDFVGPLIDLIHTPLKFEVRPADGLGRPGVLFVEGERFNIERIYPAPLPLGVGARLESRPRPDAAPRLVLRVAYEDHGKGHDHHSESKHEHSEPKNESAHREPPDHSQPHHDTAPHHGGSMSPTVPGAGFGTGPVPGLGRASEGGLPHFAAGAPMHVPTPGAMPGLGGPGHGLGSVPGGSVGGSGHGAPTGRGTSFQPLPNPLGWAPRRPDDREGQRHGRERLDCDRAAAIAGNWLQARSMAVTPVQQLEADLAAVRLYNDDAQVINDRVLPVLRRVTGRDFGPDRQAWSRWWAEENGYAAAEPPGPKPTFTEIVPPLFQPNYQTVSNSCFAAGTPVRTLDRPRPIESLKIGDLVLCQDTTTGALVFQPVLRVFHNRPAPTLKVDLGHGGSIVATAIHRFWRTGKGWAMARELKPGDVVRTLGGVATVARVTAAEVQPVYNLEVAEGHSFFVGDASALVHDNSLVAPATHTFDAPAEIAATPHRPARPMRAGADRAE